MDILYHTRVKKSNLFWELKKTYGSGSGCCDRAKMAGPSALVYHTLYKKSKGKAG